MPSVRWWVNIAILRMCLCVSVCMCNRMPSKTTRKFNFEHTTNLDFLLQFNGFNFFFYFVNAPFRVGIGEILMCELRRFPPVLSTKRHSHILQTMMLFSMSFAGLSPYKSSILRGILCVHHAIIVQSLVVLPSRLAINYNARHIVTNSTFFCSTIFSPSSTKPDNVLCSTLFNLAIFTNFHTLHAIYKFILGLPN